MTGELESVRYTEVSILWDVRRKRLITWSLTRFIKLIAGTDSNDIEKIVF